MTIRQTEISIWLAKPGSLDPFEADIASDRARQLKYPEARTNFLTGRAVARHALFHHLGSSPEDMRFESDSRGRPRLVGLEDPGFDFNISHSSALVACLVTPGPRGGIDLEALDRPLDPLRIARYSFAPEEIAAIERETEPSELFFAHWTLKEAYYKALGTGIPFKMADARFDLEIPNAIRFHPSTTVTGRAHARDWWFALARVSSGHLLAIAFESRSASEPLLQFRRHVDGGFEEGGTELIRTSVY